MKARDKIREAGFEVQLASTTRYKEIPRTSFRCSQQPYEGMYADLEAQCQVYHVCHNGRKESFLCGPGTIFNQQIRACDYWYSFECDEAPNWYYLNAEVNVESPQPLQPLPGSGGGAAGGGGGAGGGGRPGPAYLPGGTGGGSRRRRRRPRRGSLSWLGRRGWLPRRFRLSRIRRLPRWPSWTWFWRSSWCWRLPRWYRWLPRRRVPADPVLGVTQALELEDLALAVTLDLEAVGLVPVATLLEEDTALGQDQALVDKAESRLADFVVLLDQAVTAALVGREARGPGGPGGYGGPSGPVVLEALEDLVVTVVPVVPVAPGVPVVTVVRLVPVVPEVLVVTVARVVLEVLAGTAVPVAPEVLVVRKDQVVPRDQVGLEDPGVLVVLEAPAVMEAMEDPEEELELHLVALAHTWRVVVLVRGLIQVLVPRLPKAVHGLLLVDMVSFQLGLARRLRRIQVSSGADAYPGAGAGPGASGAGAQPGGGGAWQGPEYPSPTAGGAGGGGYYTSDSGAYSDGSGYPDRTRPASCQVALLKGLAEEVGVEGHRAVMGHL
ncbi:uncharacterized protein LOC119378370 [Rhipicephalus sanguineus]|uniref:uncharacterized protein LOC119378370 n=1 Tax=Rhipicephalus sanguineus TaxID=34632 RepID=UPI0020C4C967|nr:uncharacterized protein LOC119378370 [Rhipicephalus sanguineus]